MTDLEADARRSRLRDGLRSTLSSEVAASLRAVAEWATLRDVEALLVMVATRPGLSKLTQRALEETMSRLGPATVPFLRECLGHDVDGVPELAKYWLWHFDVDPEAALAEELAPPRLERLEDPDPEVRRRTVAKLLRTQDPGRFESIAPLLTDADPGVREAVARGLATAPDIRFATLHLLGAVGDEPIEAVVSEGLVAIHGRDSIPVEGGLVAIVEPRGEQAPDDVRIAAATLLGRLGSAAVLPVLARAASDPTIAPAAAAAIQARSSCGIAPHIALARDPSLPEAARVAGLRAAAAYWRAGSGNPRKAPAHGDEIDILLTFFEETECPVLREVVAEVLRYPFGQTPAEHQQRVASRIEAYPASAGAWLLEDLASDWNSPGSPVAREALERLRRREPLALGSTDLVDPLPIIRRLEEGTDEEKADAARRAFWFRCVQATPALLPLLRSADFGARRWAAVALAGLGAAEAAPLLIEALDDRLLWSGNGGEVPRTACEAHGAMLHALAKLGDDTEALGALIRHPPAETFVYDGPPTRYGDGALVRLAGKLGSRSVALLEAAIARQSVAGRPEPRLLKALDAARDPAQREPGNADRRCGS